MNPWLPLVVFFVLGIAWTIAWGWTLLRSGGPPGSFDAVYAAGGIVRRQLFYALAAVFIVVFIVSFRWFPYRGFAEARLGRPATRIAVTARMWQWTISRPEVPAGVPVEFDVTSVDVNHGFGIYDSSGRIVAQVQAMPGYTNHLVVRFPAPGQYLVRCLEFCGIPHIGMVAAVTAR
jgi:cytochrome c oxidase subunit 2